MRVSDRTHHLAAALLRSTCAPMITLTEAAVRQLQTMVADHGDASNGLRLFVEKGGCAGMQYGMKLDAPATGDEVFAREGVQVIVDQESLPFLNGTEVDYCDDLTGTGFRLKNPNAVRSCGCGTSFETSDDAGGAAH